jgi:hypothetical protein
MRRAGIVTRAEDGIWTIPEDFAESAQAFEARRRGARLQVLSWLPLEELTQSRSLTWLDGEIEAGRLGEAGAIGFGSQLREALHRRRSWLLAQGFAMETARGFTLDRPALTRLAHAEIQAAGTRLAGKLGKTYLPAIDGVRVEGTYARAINLSSGRYALLERSKDFTLVPWRDVIETRHGQIISGLVRGGSVQWEFGRKRGLGIG